MYKSVKKVTLSTDINVIEYRFINAKSLKTNESINIGIIINKNDGNVPIIKLVNNINFFHKLFPIFDINHTNTCIKLIENRYRKNNIKSVEVNISNSISLSHIRLHTEFSNENLEHIEDVIYDKYFTLSKTAKFLYQLHKLYIIKSRWFNIQDNLNEEVYINYPVETRPLFNKPLSEKIRKNSLEERIKYLKEKVGNH